MGQFGKLASWNCYPRSASLGSGLCRGAQRARGPRDGSVALGMTGKAPPARFAGRWGAVGRYPSQAPVSLSVKWGGSSEAGLGPAFRVGLGLGSHCLPSAQPQARTVCDAVCNEGE